MRKHAPGPWRIVRVDGIDEHGISHKYAPHIEIRADDRIIAIMGILPVEGYGFTAKDNEVQESNARLIAAAPRMLQHLKYAYELLDRLRPGTPTAHREEAVALLDGTLREIREVIVEAGGRE